MSVSEDNFSEMVFSALDTSEAASLDNAAPHCEQNLEFGGITFKQTGH